MLSLKPNQLSEVFTVGEDENDINNPKKVIYSIDSLFHKMKEVETQSLVELLDYQLTNSKFKTVFLFYLSNNISRLSKFIEEEKMDIFFEWLSNNFPLEKKYFKQVNEIFEHSNTMTPNEIEDWEYELKKYLNGKSTDLAKEIIDYGKAVLKECYDLHLIVCNNKYSCVTNSNFEAKIDYCEHFKKEIIEFEKQHQAKENPPPKPTNKMQWLGTQKELAELFIELEKKGWIEKIEANTLKACFTKSNSIQQVLKPISDPKSYQKTYDQVYTSQYSPSFYGIKENTKNPN